MNLSSSSRTSIGPNYLPVLCLDPPSGYILSYLTAQSFSPKGNKEIRYTLTSKFQSKRNLHIRLDFRRTPWSEPSAI